MRYLLPFLLFSCAADEKTSGERRSSEVIETQSDTFATIERGAFLYQTHCTPCHSANLRETLTGPALGNVTAYRDMDWLVAFTRNSYQMIADGDSLALRIWSCWKPTLMSNFKVLLKKEEIRAIYAFLSEESRRQEIGLEEVDYEYDCGPYLISNRDTNTWHYVDPSWATKALFDRYGFPISDFRWTQVGYFPIIQNSNLIKTVPPRIHLSPWPDNAAVEVLLLFEDHNIIIDAQPAEESYFLLSGNYWQETISVPRNAPARLLAISEAPELRLGTRRLTLGADPVITLPMEKITEAELEAYLQSLGEVLRSE